ncbi:MAG: type II toxin-antitoxin system HicA family toxin [Lachnospiraceae bacterium]|nr:type II toxin-antitoxin system HicA family toxin [Lachnospiraceae bacterium]
MKSYSSREVISMLEADGWFEINQEGSHKQFKHNSKKGKVTVNHPVKDMNVKTLKSIERQSGIRL